MECESDGLLRRRVDLLHATGLGHTNALGVGTGVAAPDATPAPSAATTAAASSGGAEASRVSGSDVLDANHHELRLEKSNILMLGPTGSGTNHLTGFYRVE